MFHAPTNVDNKSIITLGFEGKQNTARGVSVVAISSINSHVQTQ